MTKLFSRLLLPSEMVPKKLIQGELPDARTAYQTTLRLAMPALIELVLVALIGTFDTMMVGKLGPAAISSVGIATQPRMLLMALFFALNVGVTAITARKKGEGNQEQANLCLRQSIIITAVLSVILTVAAYIWARELLILAGANEEMIDNAVVYFRICALGLFFQAMALSITAAQRGIGNTKISLKVNLTANIVNIIFNYLLIEGHFGFPRLEVAGAAIATSFGNFIGLILAFLSLAHRDGFLRLRRSEPFRIDVPMIRSIWAIGSNAILEQIFLRVGFMIYARIVADLGTDPFAAHNIGMNVFNITFTLGDAFAVAATSLIGQSLGQQRRDWAYLYGKICQRIAFFFACILCAVLAIGRYFIAERFTDVPHVVDMAATVILFVAFIQFIQTTQVIMAGALRGGGDTRYVAATMLVTVTFIRPLGALILTRVFHFGLPGAWIAIIVDQLARYTLIFLRYRSCKWLTIKI